MIKLLSSNALSHACEAGIGIVHEAEPLDELCCSTRRHLHISGKLTSTDGHGTYIREGNQHGSSFHKTVPESDKVFAKGTLISLRRPEALNRKEKERKFVSSAHGA